jgi:hypothetical protein
VVEELAAHLAGRDEPEAFMFTARKVARVG